MEVFKDSILDWKFLKGSNFNLNALTILAKCSIWGAWLLGPACAPTGGYNTTLKIQADIFLWQQVQSKHRWNHFEVLVSQLYKHKPTIKTTIKSICVVSFSRIFVRQFFCKLLSKDLCQSLYILKFHAFRILFWIPLDGFAWSMKIILWDASYFRYSNNIHTAKASLQNLLMKLQ